MADGAPERLVDPVIGAAGDMPVDAAVRGGLKWRRDLFLNLTRTELTARYKTTALGILWFGLSPALLTIVFTVVFQHLLQLAIDQYALVVLAAVLPWSYSQTALQNSTTAITRSSGIVKRVRIPRALIPLSTVAASLVHFVASLTVMVALLPALGGTLTPWLFALPMVVALHTAGLAGLALLTSGLNVYYRDVEHVLALALRVGFYITPTFYPLSYVPAFWRPLALLNPMTGILEVYRALIVHGTTPPADVLTAAVLWSVLSLGLGWLTFRRCEPDFDDYV